MTELCSVMTMSPRSFGPRLSRATILPLLLLFGLATHAQRIDLSLHPTAVPDSFEVRATSTGAAFNGVPNAVFTFRWEVASGGVANNSDVRRGCTAYTLLNYGGTVDVGAYRYFTLVLFGERTLASEDCAITSASISLGGVRIRQLNGCRHVSLVENAYTGLNNLDYYFSIGGYDVTGALATTPISAGACSPCVPPQINTLAVSNLADCGPGPLTYSVQAVGTDLDYSWQRPNGTWMGHLATGSITNGMAGWYKATVTNACGLARDSVLVGMAGGTCVAPVLDTAWIELLPPTSSLVRLHTEGTGSCLSYRWKRPNGATVDLASNTTGAFPALPGTYTFYLRGMCGVDSVQIVLGEDQVCLSPTVGAIQSSGPLVHCNLDPFTLQGPVEGLPAPNTFWRGPNGAVLGSGNSLLLDPPMQGTYRLIAANACGADSAMFNIQLDTVGLAQCIPPVVQAIQAGPVCAGDTLWIEVQATATGPCRAFTWWGEGIVPVTDLRAYVAQASTEPVGLTITNACGWVQAAVPTGAVLEGAEHDLVLCGINGPVDLEATYAAALVPGGYWQGPAGWNSGVYDPAVDNVGTYFYRHPGGCMRLELHITELPAVSAGADATVVLCSSDGPTALFPFLGNAADAGGTWSGGGVSAGGVIDPSAVPAQGATVQYRVTSGPGCVDLAQLTVQVLPHYSTAQVLCLPAPALDLDSLVQAQFGLTVGAWTFAGAPHAGVFDPAIDTPGSYVYGMNASNGTVCPVVELEAQTEVRPNAGTDAAITVCSNDAPFALIDLLGPGVTAGGSWTFGFAGMNGIYDPAVHGSNTYHYTVGNMTCVDQADVVVVEVEATTWYADADGDGLGDPLESVLACAPVDGYVAVAGDACPELFGTIGDPCDDGDPDTSGDIIDTACNCAGSVGMADQQGSDLRLWPNPNAGDAFTLQVPPGTDQVFLVLRDATGRKVLQRTVRAVGERVEVRPNERLAPGVHLLEVTVGSGRYHLRMVVR